MPPHDCTISFVARTCCITSKTYQCAGAPSCTITRKSLSRSYFCAGPTYLPQPPPLQLEELQGTYEAELKRRAEAELAGGLGGGRGD